MQLNISNSGADTIVAVNSPRLDASFAPIFKAEMMEVVKGGAKRLIIDLSTVKLIDSSGLGTLVSILKSLNGQGTIVIRGATPSVVGLFKLTRMDRVFTMESAAATA